MSSFEHRFFIRHYTNAAESALFTEHGVARLVIAAEYEGSNELVRSLNGSEAPSGSLWEIYKSQYHDSEPESGVELIEIDTEEHGRISNALGARSVE